jgi:hypothetical protein
MPQRSWTFEHRVGAIVQCAIGAVLGALVGMSWILWVSPVEHAGVNWTVFAVFVVACALLSLRYGEDLWTHLKDWI